MTTLTVTVFWDLIVAVAAGCVIASLILVKELADTQIKDCRIVKAQDLENGNNSVDLSVNERNMVLSAKVGHWHVLFPVIVVSNDGLL